MNVLVVDVGGTYVKIFATGEKESRRFSSGPTMTPRQMVSGVKKLAADWQYDVVSIGYPGLVLRGRVAAEPYNLTPGQSRPSAIHRKDRRHSRRPLEKTKGA